MKTSILIAAVTFISYSGIAQSVKTEGTTGVSAKAGDKTTIKAGSTQKSELQADKANNKIASDASITGSAAASKQSGGNSLKINSKSAGEGGMEMTNSGSGSQKAGKAEIGAVHASKAQVNAASEQAIEAGEVRVKQTREVAHATKVQVNQSSEQAIEAGEVRVKQTKEAVHATKVQMNQSSEQAIEAGEIRGKQSKEVASATALKANQTSQEAVQGTAVKVKQSSSAAAATTVNEGANVQAHTKTAVKSTVPKMQPKTVKVHSATAIRSGLMLK